MPSSGPQYGKCRHCRQRFRRTGKPGRKQEYCDPACRRRAQRERSRNAAQSTDSPLPLARNIAESVQALAEGLLAAEYHEQDLAVLLRRAGELTREVEYYTCAAVHDARMKGAGFGKQLPRTPPLAPRRRGRDGRRRPYGGGSNAALPNGPRPASKTRRVTRPNHARMARTQDSRANARPASWQRHCPTCIAAAG